MALSLRQRKRASFSSLCTHLSLVCIVCASACVTYLWKRHLLLKNASLTCAPLFSFIIASPHRCHFALRSRAPATYGVTVHEVRLLSDNGKSDYVLVGEGVIFSCLFMLDPDEVIQSVVWEKDKEQVRRCDEDRRAARSMSITARRVRADSSPPVLSRCMRCAKMPRNQWHSESSRDTRALICPMSRRRQSS